MSNARDLARVNVDTDGEISAANLGNVTASSNTFTANQIIEVADNTNAALRITQTGTGNALLVEDSNPDGVGADSNEFPVKEVQE